MQVHDCVWKWANPYTFCLCRKVSDLVCNQSVTIKKHHVPEWLRTTTHKTALLRPKIRFGHVCPCHSARPKSRAFQSGKEEGTRQKKRSRNVGKKKVVAWWIMFFFNPGFFHWDKNLFFFQEIPGPTASGGTKLQTKQLTYTNTTLTKTVDTHTVQQWHITCVFVCTCVESVCISECLECDRNAGRPMEGDASWCVSPSHIKPFISDWVLRFVTTPVPPLHSSFYDFLTSQ